MSGMQVKSLAQEAKGVMNPTFRYEDENDEHAYYINDRRVPSVTEIMQEVLQLKHYANEWYMQRGTAVHACMALVAEGLTFDCDPRIEGRIEAGRKMLADIGGEVIAVEKRFWSVKDNFAGTCDLILKIGEGKLLLIDYKGTLTPQTEGQLAGYTLLAYPKLRITIGAGAELHDDGTYKMSQIYDMKRPKCSFKSYINTYNDKARWGILTKKEEQKWTNPQQA